jgi:phosphate transport system protein
MRSALGTQVAPRTRSVHVPTFAEVQDVMSRDPKTIAPGPARSFFAKHIERWADHATNVAAMVTYLIRGRDVRHGKSV